MKDNSRSIDVLKKILKTGWQADPGLPSEEEMLQKVLTEKKSPPQTKMRAAPGRPKIANEKKARNFTLCLSPKYLSFLDGMEVKDPKVRGRGRKIRFIIDQFLELHRRQRSQFMVLKQSLQKLETVLSSFSAPMNKGEKLQLTNLERREVSGAVQEVRIILGILCLTPKELHRLLPRKDWALVSFCLDWSKRESL